MDPDNTPVAGALQNWVNGLLKGLIWTIQVVLTFILFQTFVSAVCIKKAFLKKAYANTISSETSTSSPEVSTEKNKPNNGVSGDASIEVSLPQVDYIEPTEKPTKEATDDLSITFDLVNNSNDIDDTNAKNSDIVDQVAQRSVSSVSKTPEGIVSPTVNDKTQQTAVKQGTTNKSKKKKKNIVQKFFGAIKKGK